MGRAGSWIGVIAALMGVGAAVFAPSSHAAWLPPVEVSAGSEHVGSPHVVLDSAGNATAVWDRWNGSDTVVEASYRPAGEGWQEPIVLSDPDEEETSPGASDAQSPRVVADRNNNVTVTWERYAGTKIVLQSVDRPASGDWGEPKTFAEAPLAMAPEPWIAGDWEGNQTTVWVQEQTIRTAFRPFAGEWGEPKTLSGDESLTPQAAMDARGDAIAVWMRHESDRYVVESAYRPEQGEWEEPVLVSQPGEEGGNPHVAIDGKGDSLVVWRGEDEGKEVLRAAYRAAGGSWSQPTDVSSPGEAVQSPRAAVDPAGNAIAAWAGNTAELGADDIVHVSFKPAEGSWEAPKELSSAGGNSFPSDVVFDNGGNAALTWQRWDGVTNVVQAAYRPAGGDWEEPVDLSEDGKGGTDSVVVLDAPGLKDAADGYATAVWVGAGGACAGEKGTCTGSVVEASGYDPGGLPEVELEAPDSAVVGEPVEVSAGTDSLLAPRIDFGDGSSVAATDATHVYDTPGEYSVSAGGAELLGYRASAQSQIVIRSADESEPPKEGSEPPPSGGSHPEIPMPAAQPAAGTEPSPACLSARAANEAALLRLRRLRVRVSRAAGRSRGKRLTVAKRHQLEILNHSRAEIASAC